MSRNLVKQKKAMEPGVSADESSLQLPDLNDSNVDLVEFVMKRRRRRICDGPLFPPFAQPFSPIDIKFLKKKVPPSMENIPPPTSHEAACASVPSTTKTLPPNVAQVPPLKVNANKLHPKITATNQMRGSSLSRKVVLNEMEKCNQIVEVDSMINDTVTFEPEAFSTPRTVPKPPQLAMQPLPAPPQLAMPPPPQLVMPPPPQLAMPPPPPPVPAPRKWLPKPLFPATVPSSVASTESCPPPPPIIPIVRTSEIAATSTPPMETHKNDYHRVAININLNSPSRHHSVRLSPPQTPQRHPETPQRDPQTPQPPPPPNTHQETPSSRTPGTKVAAIANRVLSAKQKRLTELNDQCIAARAAQRALESTETIASEQQPFNDDEANAKIPAVMEQTSRNIVTNNLNRQTKLLWPQPQDATQVEQPQNTKRTRKNNPEALQILRSLTEDLNAQSAVNRNSSSRRTLFNTQNTTHIVFKKPLNNTATNGFRSIARDDPQFQPSLSTTSSSVLAPAVVLDQSDRRSLITDDDNDTSPISIVRPNLSSRNVLSISNTALETSDDDAVVNDAIEKPIKARASRNAEKRPSLRTQNKHSNADNINGGSGDNLKIDMSVRDLLALSQRLNSPKAKLEMRTKANGKKTMKLTKKNVKRFTQNEQKRVDDNDSEEERVAPPQHKKRRRHKNEVPPKKPSVERAPNVRSAQLKKRTKINERQSDEPTFSDADDEYQSLEQQQQPENGNVNSVDTLCEKLMVESSAHTNSTRVEVPRKMTRNSKLSLLHKTDDQTIANESEECQSDGGPSNAVASRESHSDGDFQSYESFDQDSVRNHSVRDDDSSSTSETPVKSSLKENKIPAATADSSASSSFQSAASTQPLVVPPVPTTSAPDNSSSNNSKNSRKNRKKRILALPEKIVFWTYRPPSVRTHGDTPSGVRRSKRSRPLPKKFWLNDDVAISPPRFITESQKQRKAAAAARKRKSPNRSGGTETPISPPRSTTESPKSKKTGARKRKSPNGSAGTGGGDDDESSSVAKRAQLDSLSRTTSTEQDPHTSALKDKFPFLFNMSLLDQEVGSNLYEPTTNVARANSLHHEHLDGLNIFYYPNFSKGFIKFSISSKKKRCRSKDTLNLLVLAGAVTVVVDEHPIELTIGDNLCIQPGSMYAVQNVPTEESLIFFSKSDN